MWHAWERGETVGKPEGNRILGRSRHRWDNIKIDLKKRKIKGVAWTHVGEDSVKYRAVVDKVMNC
jgi:hypothetical protein